MQVLNTNWNLLAEDIWRHLLAPECLWVKSKYFQPLLCRNMASPFSVIWRKMWNRKPAGILNSKMMRVCHKHFLQQHHWCRFVITNAIDFLFCIYTHAIICFKIHVCKGFLQGTSILRKISSCFKSPSGHYRVRPWDELSPTLYHLHKATEFSPNYFILQGTVAKWPRQFSLLLPKEL